MDYEKVSFEENKKRVHRAIKDAELFHSKNKIMEAKWTTLQSFKSVMEDHAYDRGYVTDVMFQNAILLFFRHTKFEGNENESSEQATRSESINMTTRSSSIKSVHIIKESGNIYLLDYKGAPTPAVCVGETYINSKPGPQDKLVPFFYVFGHVGISYWEDLTIESLCTKTLLHKLKYEKFDFQNLKSQFEAPSTLQLFENLEVLGDCTLICSNGKLKSSKFLLSQNSTYFFTYFTRYSNGQNIYPLLEYKVEVVKEYLRFLITKQVELKNISESIVESLTLASYVQDLVYMNYLYDLVYQELELQEQKEIKKVVKQLLYLKK